MEEVLEKILTSYRENEGNIITILHDLEENFGYIPEEAMDWLSKKLDIPASKLYGVATFYAMYRFQPGGKHLIKLCRSVSCMLMGANSLIDFLKDKYGLEEGSTSPDGRFSLMMTECIGGCDTAPAMLIDDDFYGNITLEKIEDILKRYK